MPKNRKSIRKIHIRILVILSVLLLMALASFVVYRKLPSKTERKIAEYTERYGEEIRIVERKGYISVDSLKIKIVEIMPDGVSLRIASPDSRPILENLNEGDFIEVSGYKIHYLYTDQNIQIFRFEPTGSA